MSSESYTMIGQYDWVSEGCNWESRNLDPIWDISKPLILIVRWIRQIWISAVHFVNFWHVYTCTEYNVEMDRAKCASTS